MYSTFCKLKQNKKAKNDKKLLFNDRLHKCQLKNASNLKNSKVKLVIAAIKKKNVSSSQMV